MHEPQMAHPGGHGTLGSPRQCRNLAKMEQKLSLHRRPAWHTAPGWPPHAAPLDHVHAHRDDTMHGAASHFDTPNPKRTRTDQDTSESLQQPAEPAIPAQALQSLLAAPTTPGADATEREQHYRDTTERHNHPAAHSPKGDDSEEIRHHYRTSTPPSRTP